MKVAAATACFVGAAAGGAALRDAADQGSSELFPGEHDAELGAGAATVVGGVAAAIALARHRSIAVAGAALAGIAVGTTWKSMPTSVSYPLDFGIGMAMESVNLLGSKVPVPDHPSLHGPDGLQGDLFEPSRPGERAGADVVDWIGRHVGALQSPSDQAKLRTARSLLASTTIDASSAQGAVTVLDFDAAAPGDSWSTSGKESGMVAVYVDGKHVADTAILNENTSHAWQVNLGELAPGTHTVELRDATDEAAPSSAAVQVSNVHATTLTGDDALIAAHAPTFEGRSLDGSDDQRETATDDTPLDMTATVTHHDDGSETISYRMTFSGEDGGSYVPDLYENAGRALDEESGYEITLAANGSTVSESYEGPMHVVHPFTGQHEDGRAELRVSSSNNNFSERLRGIAPVWSPVPQLESPGSLQWAPVLDKPWMLTVMAEELQRQGDVAATPDTTHIADPRRYLYLPKPDDLLQDVEHEQPIELRLRDGSTVAVTADYGTSDLGPQGTAVLLPNGITGADVAAVVGATGEALVLDANDQPRVLPDNAA